MAILDANGAPADTMTLNRSRSYVNGEVRPVARFTFQVPRCDSTYVLEISCPHYKTLTMTYEVKNIGKRETYRQIPTIFLERAPRELKELTVTTTKIKFYNKGDTVVYNADAFELAEGSMLDALIAQLPGVELKEGGQILVNGEQVESLLLNGKEFFNNNNELMLENIGAYTVKNIEVYKGQTPDEKWNRDLVDKKHLTMDVKLKREYNTGLTANAQVGYGTSDRYSARLFGMWYSPTTRFTAVGNFNNLNDTRKPGQNDSWTPEMMPSGTKKYQLGAVDYNYTNPEETRRFRGDITYTATINNNTTTTARTNFLPGGNTYENSYSNSHNRNTRLSSYHYGSWRGKSWMPGYTVKAVYQDKDNDSESLSGAFSREQQDMTMEALKAIYSTGTEQTIASILNRASSRSDGRSHSTELQAFPYLYYFIPKSNDRVSNEFGIKYNWSKEDIWKDYVVNYGADPEPAERRRQFIDNQPRWRLALQDNVTYTLGLGNLFFDINYEYIFKAENKDSYQYALDRLADVGIYGSLPSGWVGTLDPQNSYTSRLLENSHGLSIAMYNYKRTDRYDLTLQLNPTFNLLHSHFDYERGGVAYPLRKSYFLTTVGRYQAYAILQLYGKDRKRPKHTIEVNAQVTPKTPALTDMVDITDDTNPLNIYVGNPDLKVEYNYSANVAYKFNGSATHPFYDRISATGSITTNALTRGYTYNTSNGIRINRMDNVGSNRSFTADNTCVLQFGNNNQYTVSSTTNFSLSRYSDLIGIDMQEPAMSVVDNRIISQNLSFSWHIGKQTLLFKGEFGNRHSYSSREDFNTINANNFSYGIVANFKLPYGIGINTDFNMYGRRGYGVKELDTTDAIWNLRLTWTPKRLKCWTLMIDGFDMLHQLSNVNYAVTASGRTVSYSNALPRYILFSIQYRFQRQPKKH